MKFYTASLCFIIVFCSHASAQLPADTSVQLKEFTTTSTRFSSFSTGIKTSSTDSLTKLIVSQNNLAQLLAYNSPVFIKSYGPAQLATTSFRGAGAEHTAVLWNGINLQSNMHGQLDFTQLPAGFMDDVELYSGGNSALYGAGAVGGAVVLGNKASFNKKLAVNYSHTIGSFGLMRNWGGLEYGNNKYYIKAKAYRSEAENNYGYHDYTLTNEPLRYRTNAEVFSTGSMMEAGTKINSKNEVNLRYWYNYNNSNIPPTIGMAFNKAYQIDEHHRIGADWKFIPNDRNFFITRIAYLNERLDYDDPSTFLSGRSRSKNLISEVEYYHIINKNVSLNAGVNYSHLNAKSESYIREANQNRIALFSSLKALLHKKLTATVSIRQEMIDKKFQPFTASAGLNYDALQWLSFMAHANKSYRVPTFNDLYWITGNPDLKAENGYGQELGMRLRFSNSKTMLETNINAFNRNINNWIVWQPNGGTWTPQNLREVWSRGVEFNYKVSRSLNKLMISLRGELSYVLSTNQKAFYANDESVGKQLIYIPRFTQQHWISITFKKLYVAFNHTYTGYRFISTDNSTFINDYYLANVFAGYGFGYKKTAFDLRLQYNNVLNKHYEVLPAKPMPLSNYQLTLSIKFNS